MEIESKQQIIERRKEIDPIRKRSASNGAGQEIVDMLKETESDFTLDHVRERRRERLRRTGARRAAQKR